MRKAAAILAALACLPGTSRAQPAASAPTLESVLARANACAEALSRLAAGGSEVVTTRQDTLDRDGRVKAWEERSVRYTKAPGGERAEILRWVKDGEEMSESERKAAQRSFDSEDDFDMDLPFRADVREKYRFRAVGPLDGPRVRIAFEPAGKPESRVNVGEVEVEAATGFPVRATLRPSRLPFYVKKLDAVIEYGATTPAGPAPSRMIIDAIGGFFFYTRTVRATTTWSDRRYAVAAVPTP